MLRDSIGGNCKTKMIATIHVNKQHLNESLDTCQFARRVSLIQNSAIVNQVSDPAVIINGLRKQISELKAEITLLKGTDDDEDMLTPEAIDECNQQVEKYIKNTDPSATLVLTDRLRINQSFYHFKTLYKNLAKKAKSGEGAGVRLVDSDEESKEDKSSGDAKILKDLVKKLQLEVKRRDNEINILVGHVNKLKGTGADVPVSQAPVDDDDYQDGKKLTFYQMMMNKKENVKPNGKNSNFWAFD